MKSVNDTIKSLYSKRKSSKGTDSVRRMVLSLALLMTMVTAWAGSKPVMNIDAVQTYTWSVKITGWAYDPDAPDDEVDYIVTFYTDAECQNPTASSKGPTYLVRDDVNSAHGISGRHGFDEEIYLGSMEIPAEGTYYVKIYALDKSGGDGYVESTYGPLVVGIQAAPVFGGKKLELTTETEALRVGDGCVITGTGGYNTCIVIEDGATVTLSGMDITSYDNILGNTPIGIKCLGNATIILDKGTTNYVRGGRQVEPNILAGPKNTTLTIKGYGSLVARSYGHGACIGPYDGMECGNIVIESGTYDLDTSIDYQGNGYSGHAACIGGSGNGGKCGNITITGGNITAWSHFGAAAIGTGRVGSCGNITITGGNIYARSESPQGGAAIGGGLEGNCGNISISGFTSVSAVKYSDDTPYCIGPGGANSTCGTLTLWGQVTDYPVGHARYDGPNVFAPTDIPYTVSFNANGGTGEMASQDFYSNTPQELHANTFTLDGKFFTHWSTTANGEGCDYEDKESVTNLGNVTLYAQWHDSYTIHYEANGGTGTMDDQKNTTAVQVLNANVFTRTDHFFAGWNTEADGSGTSYADGEAVRVMDNMTLYAQWTSAEITLTEDTGDVLLVNGHILTGTGGENTHVTISDGATVRLSNVDITAISYKNHWAGITCAGDATIVLVDGTTNDVKGNSGQFPGIFVPAGKTLTIKGSGTLTVNNDGSGAGIGAGLNLNGGNITIESGTVIASGGNEAAGIGGAQGAGCGNITITDGVASVTASGGWNAPNSIGAGNSYCGTVTIGGIETGSIVVSPYTYKPAETALYTITFNGNEGEGTMDAQPLASNIPQALAANAFTRSDYIFMGWNTAADGSGTGYSNGQTVMNTGSVTLYAQWSPANDITMISATGYLKLHDGQSLSGTGGANTHIAIADGATVTLKGVDITNIANDDRHQWAGISCLGDATIILADGTTNSVKGGHYYYPGIHVPEGKTLIIRGAGTLNAGSNGLSAGIGGGKDIKCGNITIESGTVNATATGTAAGIGGGNVGSAKDCGDITITGGTITAIGDVWGSGIGGVQSCGHITITDGVTSVTAIKGNLTSFSIGTGGAVSIGGVETCSIEQSPYTYIPAEKTLYTISYDANAGEGTMDDQTLVSNIPQPLTANAFTRANYEFVGWNTAADGSGTGYTDSQAVTNIGSLTLYAQWKNIRVKIIDSHSTDVMLVNGDTITGTGGSKTHVTIADGATVILKSVDITSISTKSSYRWAGITCLGDATIILKGDNAVTGGYHSAGITVPAGKTLTITGDGSLTATGAIYGAGIGCGEYASCGNIVLEGGTITAIAGDLAAAIGCGDANSSEPSSCGDITIKGSVTRVTAIRESDNADIIGISDEYYSTCGTITIAPNLIDVLSDDGTTRTLTGPVLELADGGDNSGTIEGYDSQMIKVVLADRTLYKDGCWNTLCLPFALSETQMALSPLEGAVLKELDGTTSNLADGVLTLNFKAATSIEAGKPYIVKWAISEPDVIVNPAFSGVTIDASASTSVAFDGGSFVGTYSPVALAVNDQSNLFLGGNNTLYWPDGANNADGNYYLNACRAYFHIDNSSLVREFVLNFDAEDMTTTGISLTSSPSPGGEGSGCWFSIDGVKLGAKPTKQGVYIVNGRKVVIK